MAVRARDCLATGAASVGDLVRISINAARIEGPFGGANQFVTTLERHLRRAGHDVFREMVPDLDVILLVASQPNLRMTAYDDVAVERYRADHPETVVVHRVNTCDEQRGADLGANRAVVHANRLADHTVFVSEFIRDHYFARGIDPTRPHSIIRSGADPEVFHPRGRASWSPGERLRIVTHHWSSNYLKGFDVYERLDLLLAEPPFSDRFAFRVIGNVTLGVRFHHATVLPVRFGHELADALRAHHIYLTGARHEPAGNHYVEGMRCGLPVLYLQSGATPEYCGPYGVGFTLADFERRLLEVADRYAELRERVLDCPWDAERTAAQYLALFEDLVARKRRGVRSARVSGTTAVHADG